MTMAPWSRFLFQKQIVLKLLKKYGEFYEKPKFYYCFSKCLLCVPILSRINPINNLPFYFYHMNFSINFLSTYTSSWSLSLGFPHHNPTCNPPVPHKRNMHRPLPSSWFHHMKRNDWGVQVMKFHIMQRFPIRCYLVPLRLSTPFSNTPILLLMWEKRFHSHKQEGETKYVGPNGKMHFLNLTAFRFFIHVISIFSCGTKCRASPYFQRIY